MRLICLFTLIICIHQNTWAQSDVLVLKEKGRNIRSWVKDDFIRFQYVTTQWIEGKIKNIARDSVFINAFVTRQIPNQFGFPTIDTAWFGLMGIHISEFIGMPGNPFKSGIFTNGTLLQLGGAAYIFLNLFNSIQGGEQVFSSSNLTSIGIAAGVFMIGKIQSWRHRPYIQIRKKYSMQIISTSPLK